MLAVWLAGLLTMAAPRLWADSADGAPCGALRGANDFAGHRDLVQCLVDADQAREAVRVAKRERLRRPEQRDYARLLARAYLAQGNSFWALRTLSGLVRERPDDCLTRSMIAWVHLHSAFFERAEEALGASECPRRPADRARWALYRALIAQARGETAVVRSELSTVEDIGRIYPDDQPLWRHLSTRVRAYDRAPFHFRADMSYGYTSDVRAGLPIVPLPEGEASSMFRARLSGRAVWPSHWAVRPGIEGSLRGELYDNFSDRADVSQLNQLDVSVRPVAVVDLDTVIATLGYRASLFMVHASDPIESASPWVLTEGHRAELDLALPRGFTALAGFGHRTVAWRGRSRWEFDGGAGWAKTFPNGHTLLAAVSGRFHSARSDLYLRGGGRLALSWRLPLSHRLSGRMRLSQGLDYLPNSPQAGGVYSLLEAQAEVWFKIWRGVEVGIGYELAWAAGTTEVLAMYTAHRLMPTFRWNWSWDRATPGVVGVGGHVGLDYGMSAGSAEINQDRVEDLMRHDSVSQQASSCGVR